MFALLQFFPDNLNTIIELHVRKFGLERAFNLSPFNRQQVFPILGCWLLPSFSMSVPMCPWVRCSLERSAANCPFVPICQSNKIDKHISEISFDIVAVAEFVQLMPERSVRRLVAYVGSHTGELRNSINQTAIEKNLTAIREHLADNFYILGCAIHCGHPEAETVKPITLRNRFLKNQQRFKKIKAIQ